MNASSRNFVSNIIFILIIIFALLFFYYIFFQQATRSRQSERIFIPLKSENIKKIKLKNGLTALLLKKEHSPKVLVQMNYHVGSSNESYGNRGIAHLIEHMLFKGTKQLSESDIETIARKYGATYNAHTSPDMTSYYFETNKHNWKPFLSIFADTMQNARFNEQHLHAEINTIIHELHFTKDNYKKMMRKKALELLYPPSHPYHAAVIGNKYDLANTTTQKLKQFYHQFYHPKNAVLIIIGDINFNEVENIIKRTFEHIPPPKKLQESIIHLNNKYAINNTSWYLDTSNEILGIYWSLPGKNSQQTFISTPAAFLLGIGKGSRLHKTLIDKYQIASKVKAYATTFEQAGIFFIQIQPLPGKKDLCKKIVLEEISQVIQKGFTKKELDRLLEKKYFSFFQKLTNFRRLAKHWSKAYFATKDEYYFLKNLEAYKNLTSKKVQQFLSKHMNPSDANNIEILPIPRKYRLKKFQDQIRQYQYENNLLKKHKRTSSIEPPKFANNMPSANLYLPNISKPDIDLTLDNGLRILLKQDLTTSLIHTRCYFRNSYFLTSSKNGLFADLMMKMLIEGTKEYSKKENLSFFDQHGIIYSSSNQGCFISMLAYNHKTLLERFFNLLLQPTFPRTSFKKWKKIYIEHLENQQRNISSYGKRLLKMLIYQNHPYGWSYGDAIKLIAQSKRKDLFNFHKQYVTPSNIILSIIGNFKSHEITQFLKRILNNWREQNKETPILPKSNFIPKKYADKFIAKNYVTLLFGQPSKINFKHPDYLPLKLLNFITFKSLGSRIYQLRKRYGLFYSASGGWAQKAIKNGGYDFVKTTVNPKNAHIAEQHLKNLITTLSKNGITQEELNAAKQWYINKIINKYFTPYSFAKTLCKLASYDLDLNYYKKQLDRLKKLTVKDLNISCTKYFDLSNMARVRVGNV